MELGDVGDAQPTSDGGLYSGGYNEEGREDHCIKGRRSSGQRLASMGELTERFHTERVVFDMMISKRGGIYNESERSTCGGKSTLMESYHISGGIKRRREIRPLSRSEIGQWRRDCPC